MTTGLAPTREGGNSIFSNNLEVGNQEFRPIRALKERTSDGDLCRSRRFKLQPASA